MTVAAVMMMKIITNFLRSSSYALSTVLSPLQVFSLHSNLLREEEYPHFTDEETESESC